MARLVKRTKGRPVVEDPNKLYCYDEQGNCKEAKDDFPGMRYA